MSRTALGWTVVTAPAVIGQLLPGAARLRGVEQAFNIVIEVLGEIVQSLDITPIMSISGFHSRVENVAQHERTRVKTKKHDRENKINRFMTVNDDGRDGCIS